jgi:hypothetical protein
MKRLVCLCKSHQWSVSIKNRPVTYALSNVPDAGIMSTCRQEQWLEQVSAGNFQGSDGHKES